MKHNYFERFLLLFCVVCCSPAVVAQQKEWKIQRVVERGISCIACLDEQRCVIGGQEIQFDDTFIFQTMDGGKTWKKVYADTGMYPKRALQLSSLAWISPDVIVASADSSYIIRSVDGGKTWAKTRVYDGFAYAKPMYFCDSLHGVLFETKGVPNEEFNRPMVTSDGGATWQLIPGPKNTGELEQTMMLSGACIAPGKYIGFEVNSSGFAINRTTDYGKTWDQKTNPFSLPNGLRWHGGFFFLDSLNGWFTAPGDFQPGYGYPVIVARTSNGGESWTVMLQDTLPMKLFGFQTITFTNLLRGIGTSGGRICRTTDGGASWSVDSILLEKGSNTRVAMMKQEPHVVAGGGGLVAYLDEVSSVEQASPARETMGEIVVKNVGDYVEVEFTSENPEAVHAWCDDLQGRRVITERTVEGRVGKQSIQIDIRGLPSGTYFITVQQGAGRRTAGFQLPR
ncbi:MAG: hypothetical protein IPM61_02470 [Chlorobi bacterium]|nr:MAG: Ycf48-like protein [Chlorobi bacterium OLB7]MBK8910170.1 hypothetical protein [Chlorobiota bacterium]